MSHNRLLGIASEYAAESGRRNGVVIIYNGQVAGWVDKLRDPHHWCPGCFGVIQGNDHVYIAHGGDDINGAKSWVPVELEDLE